MTTIYQKPDIVLTPAEAAVLKIPFEKVYKLSPDGKTYLAPPLLRGTPVQRIDESHTYWERSWDSINTLLAKQGPEAEKKREAYARTQLDPTNKALQDALKRYCDNSSKFKKIREIFGEGSNYHPNQIIGKKYLPPRGMCQKESMYRLACKISDLQHLKKTGELAMDPFDFIRWRIMKKAASLLAKPGDNPKQFIRTIVYKLSDEPKDFKERIYQDSIMRRAVLFSAGKRNLQGHYGSKKRFGKGASMKKPGKNNNSQKKRDEDDLKKKPDENVAPQTALPLRQTGSQQR